MSRSTCFGIFTTLSTEHLDDELPHDKLSSRKSGTVTRPMLHPWEGVFASFNEAPTEGPGFSGDRWRQASLALAKDTLAKEASGEPLDFSLTQRNAVLPGVAATLRNLRGKVRILDIGGGLGTGYTVLRTALLGHMQGVSYGHLEQ